MLSYVYYLRNFSAIKINLLIYIKIYIILLICTAFVKLSNI